MLLKTEEFNPILLKAGYFTGYDFEYKDKLNIRVVYDYEVEYYINSNGGVIINNTYIPYEKGDIGIRKPGQRVCGVMPYACYMLAIDFKGNNHKKEGYMLGEWESKQPCFENNILSALPMRIPASEAEYAGGIIKKLYEENLYQTELNQLSIKANVLLLIKELYKASVDKNSIQGIVHPAIKCAINHINQNFTNDIQIMDLIGQSGLSKAYFHRLFKQYTGSSPNQLIMKLRLEKAKYLLSVGHQEVAEIGYQCGYYDSIYFSYLFKKHIGITPTEFRRNCRN